MAFVGRYRKGDLVPLAFVAKTAAGVPTLPDAVPSIIVYSDTASVKTLRPPVKDRYVVTAFFFVALQLGPEFNTAGRYRAVMNYTISSTPLWDIREFEVANLGALDGLGTAVAMMEVQHADYAVLATYSGRLKKFRNPRSVS